MSSPKDLVICRELSNLGRTQRQQNLKERSCTEAAPNEETQNEAEEDICREADTCRDSRPRQKRKPDKARDWIRIIPWTTQHQDHIENGPERPKEPDSKPIANPRGQLFQLDPEIERTGSELRLRARAIMQGGNGRNLADGEEQGLRGQNPPAQAGHEIAPPQNHQQPPARTIRDYLAEDLEGLNPAVTTPEFEAEHFELKPVMFNMLNTLGQFGGSPAENARQHLKSFLEICNSFKIHGVSNDILKLKLFPYSLTDKARAWLNNLQPGSLRSWTELCRSFLAKFSYNNMTDNLRNQITSFRQEDDEAMHEAWERYRDLFRRCPMHGLPEWTQVSIFYNSVNTPTRMMLDASANGTLLDKPPREGLEILDKLAQNDYQHPTSRRGNARRGTAQLDSSDTILAQLASLTNMVKNMQKQPHIQEVKAFDAFCEQCESNHDAS
ncbi:hypothetical protein V6N13_001512 [Hibiscus sabdariffa]